MEQLLRKLFSSKECIDSASACASVCVHFKHWTVNETLPFGSAFNRGLHREISYNILTIVPSNQAVEEVTSPL